MSSTSCFPQPGIGQLALSLLGERDLPAAPQVRSSWLYLGTYRKAERPRKENTRLAGKLNLRDKWNTRPRQRNHNTNGWPWIKHLKVMPGCGLWLITQSRRGAVGAVGAAAAAERICLGCQMKWMLSCWEEGQPASALPAAGQGRRVRTRRLTSVSCKKGPFPSRIFLLSLAALGSPWV